MSLLDTASLIVTPNGVKEGKLYSVIPSDGSGDLSVVRATTATRVNSAGLVELVPYNLLTYSQNFTIGWSASPIGTITSSANFGIAPDGTTTSTRIIFTGASQIYRKTISGITGTTGVFSLWIKGTAGETITITYGGVSDKLVTLGDGWNRFNTDGNVAAINDIFINTFLSATARDIEVWGGQVNEGSTPKDYQKTETRLNIPRLDYSNGTCPSLLVEPQRTNLLTYSSSFDNAAWVKVALTVTANDTTSPDGTQNADKLIESTTTSGHFLIQSPTLTIASYTFTTFAKAGERNWFLFRQHTLGLNASFNLATGTLGTIAAGLTASIEDYGSGWYRCSVTFTGTAAANTLRLYVTTADNNTSSYAGDNTSGLYLYGAQLEAGSYPTSYIPTTSASVTRNADVISKTGISSLIGQTEGTLFFDSYVTITGDSSSYAGIILNNGTNSNVIAVGYYQDGRIQAAVFVSGSLLVNIDLPSFGLTNGKHKFALAYKLNDYVFYVDGIEVGSDTSATVPATSVFNLSYLFGEANISHNAVALWKQRLTNTQLAQLTTI